VSEGDNIKVESLKTTATVINTEDFKTISADSIKREYNRLPSDELLDLLDPEGTHIMQLSLPHEHIAGVLDPEGHVRTMWMMKLTDKTEPVTVYLDMTWENFNSLAKIRKAENGDWVRVETPDYGMGQKVTA
jgi:hypothetical protein